MNRCYFAEIFFQQMVGFQHNIVLLVARNRQTQGGNLRFICIYQLQYIKEREWKKNGFQIVKPIFALAHNLQADIYFTVRKNYQEKYLWNYVFIYWVK